MKHIFLVLFTVLFGACKAQETVLVFTKTEGFRHKSIETGVQAIRELGQENKFKVLHTEDSKTFSENQLKKIDLVLFLNTTGDVFNSGQEAAFKKYINNGGSFMGIHAATDTEFEWPWFGKLVGAYFLNHPKQCEAHITIKNSSHPATKHLENPWVHFDEWYNFKDISPDLNVLLTLDESSYEGGKNGDYHPIAWCQEYDGGRMFYTGLGHTKEAYANSKFRKHVLGGILYCLRR